MVTGAAGFIGSHLVEELLLQGQNVIGFDNFSTGKEQNLFSVKKNVGEDLWKNYTFIRGDLADRDKLELACRGVDVILHHAAFGSVPLSLENPHLTNATNVTGFVNLLDAARCSGVRRVVYASSSSVYGNCADLPLQEKSAGAVLSPYAASKWIDEIYARTYSLCYGMELIGLRYFNVFGPRQDPNGAYAAVIPKWINALTSGEQIIINGDGSNTRDFCFVQDVVKANLLAAFAKITPHTSLSLNIGTGHPVSLVQLYETLCSIAYEHGLEGICNTPIFGPARSGDIIHSTADISNARHKINFSPSVAFKTALHVTFKWFHEQPIAG